MTRHSKNKRSKTSPGTSSQPGSGLRVIRLEPEQLEPNKSNFTCEFCGQIFYRKPNLNFHLQSHYVKVNLRDKGGRGEVIYTCPVPDCVHHDSDHALGDITGIKKHYARKHCEKKFECRKNCNKMYALESDRRAHEKRCKAPVQENQNQSHYEFDFSAENFEKTEILPSSNKEFVGPSSGTFYENRVEPDHQGSVDPYNLTFMQLLSCTNLPAQDLDVLFDIESVKLTGCENVSTEKFEEAKEFEPTKLRGCENLSTEKIEGAQEFECSKLRECENLRTKNVEGAKEFDFVNDIESAKQGGCENLSTEKFEEAQGFEFVYDIESAKLWGCENSSTDINEDWYF